MADTRIDELRRRLERDPGSRLFAQLAEELRKNAELPEAIRVARAGLAVHPVYASARLTLGRALLDSGDAAAARAELESAVRDAPDNIQASRYLAQAREQLGDLAGAAEQYRKTLLMAPEDRQVQGALAAVEVRLNSAGGASERLGAETTPPFARRTPPPLPTGALAAPDAPAPGPRGTAAAAAAAAAPPARAGAPPVVLAPARPAAAPEPAADRDAVGEEAALAPTLRIHAAQAAAPPPAAPEASPEPRTLPGSPLQAAAAAAEAGEGVASASTTPFSSSTLAELYFQQGLVDRAVDVYRQLLEQEPHNEKARGRLSELERAAPVADDRAARRRALERTIAGLETLLGAVRRG